ncbi:hypothetical protein ACFE04_029021 [Oxalis oulophora]
MGDQVATGYRFGDDVRRMRDLMVTSLRVDGSSVPALSPSTYMHDGDNPQRVPILSLLLPRDSSCTMVDTNTPRQYHALGAQGRVPIILGHLFGRVGEIEGQSPLGLGSRRGLEPPPNLCRRLRESVP